MVKDYLTFEESLQLWKVTVGEVQKYTKGSDRLALRRFAASWSFGDVLEAAHDFEIPTLANIARKFFEMKKKEEKTVDELSGRAT